MKPFMAAIGSMEKIQTLTNVHICMTYRVDKKETV